MYFWALNEEISYNDDKCFCDTLFVTSCIYLQRFVGIFNQIASSIFKSSKDVKLAFSNDLCCCASNLVILSYFAAILYAIDHCEIKHKDTSEFFLINNLVTKYGAKEFLRLIARNELCCFIKKKAGS